MENREYEWLYVAAQPAGVLYGPTKIGWTARDEPSFRIGEHERQHRRIELVVGFRLPCPVGWGIEREIHRRLRRYRSAKHADAKEWYNLPANECVIAVARLVIGVLGEAEADRICVVHSGPGWGRLLQARADRQDRC